MIRSPMTIRRWLCGCGVLGAMWSGSAADPASALQAEWHLAVAPVSEFGLREGLALHRVTGAVVLTDGSLVIADAGNHRLLHVSAQGELVRTLGRRGGGPGEFESITALFATDTTVLAYDGMQSRVTVWQPGGNPTVYRLPTPQQRPTALAAVASASEWILTGNEPLETTSRGLVTQDASILTYDPVEDRSVRVDLRPVRYGYVRWSGDRYSQGSTQFRMGFLGSAHIAGKAGSWFFVPIDSAVVEIRDATEEADPTKMRLPMESGPYSVRKLREARDGLISISSSSHANRLRQVYDDVERNLPPRTPPARRVLMLGENLWVERFESRTDGGSVWLVIDPSERKVLATAAIGPGITLLGGNGSVAAVLTRTELGEEVVSVRSILRP